MVSLPVLYSFRRCPYAIRARLALLHSNSKVELREVVLRDRPPSLLEYSPKGTVPVLVLPNGEILEESMDIMLWCIGEEMLIGDWQELVELNDNEFKGNLDRYKYPDRFDDVVSMEFHRNKCLEVLNSFDRRLDGEFMMGNELSIADFVLVPFIRQFANTDRDWFQQQDIPSVKRWMEGILKSELFISSMTKYDQWHEGDGLEVLTKKEK
jgi:glutathione S-transferase|tara:strand:- start:186 stop:815 length:630 start_codon:yes stop_codon:yes gene_type:complete